MSRQELTLHELGILTEKDVRLENGVFQLQTSLKMVRLEDRIEFLHAKFSGSKIDHSEPWWSQLSDATKLRNKLTHPKDQVIIDERSVGMAIQAVIDVLDVLYRALYKRGFPAAGLQLDSQLDF